MKLIKNKISNHIEHLIPVLLAIGVIYIINVYFDWNYQGKFYLTLFIVIQLLIMLFLYFEYYIRNKGTKLIVEDNKYIYFKNAEVTAFNNNSIVRIEHHRSNTNKLILFFWSYYNFTKIILKDDKEIYITSLMKDKFDIDGVHEYYKVYCPRFFPTTLFYSKIFQSDHEFD